MHYEGTVIRPPSEANSIILQVTLGCSHNKCTFCAAYKDKTFSIKSDADIRSDIDFASRHCNRLRRVFLADGDALIIPHTRLVSIFREIRNRLPQISRISLYGNAKSIRSKCCDQLNELKNLGLDRIYMGLETGDNGILQEIRKGETAETMIDAALKVRRSKIFLSVTVLLGIGGIALSNQHALATAATLNKMRPNQIAALTLMILENSPLYINWEQKEFVLPDREMLLKELKIMLSNLTLNRCQFHCNHGSNYLPLEGRLSKDKESLLKSIDLALAGKIRLVPEYLRAL